uniref:Zinc finger CCCH domain-containing protein 37 n=1 Tax=Anthurium amnicola TaxID=1678845 RepID=A0A1D1Z012_9ARAE
MANHLYRYGSSYGGPGLPSTYSSRVGGGDAYLSDPSLVGSSRYLSSDPFSAADTAKFSTLETSPSSPYLSRFATMEGYSSSKISGGMGATSVPSVFSKYGASLNSSLLSGTKRHSEALYHQTLLGTHNNIGQSEALFSTNSLAKRPKLEIASHLPIYPQRPGEKDCTHYMLTRTCKFGDNCKFDHPLWVPEGGIPDWKEVPVINTVESLPERSGEQDCPYFMKTQRCKFGVRCKFNHPKENISGMTDISILPERPSEPICSFYAKTGKCKFGANCIFHHPKDLEIPSSGQDASSAEQADNGLKDGIAVGDSEAVKLGPFTPALLHNSKGLPIRLGEQDCPFYLKTGSCKYGAACRYNHPDRNAIYPAAAAAALGHSIISPPAANLPIGIINPAASLLANIDPRFTQAAMGVAPTIYPQRPGHLECDFYMKTGQCKFGERCKFHHPIDRSAPAPSMIQQPVEQNIKLTLAGLPRREGEITCPYYMKTGTCKFGPSCKFDHPTPAEAIAMVSAKGSTSEVVTATGTGEDAVEITVQGQQ